jgi:hypothetical protein
LTIAAIYPVVFKSGRYVEANGGADRLMGIAILNTVYIHRRSKIAISNTEI